MSNNRLRTASALAVSVVLLATPALGQGTAGESGDMVLLKAEIKMLKSLLTKQREQMNALQKQIADLTARQQLRQIHREKLGSGETRATVALRRVRQAPFLRRGCRGLPSG